MQDTAGEVNTNSKAMFSYGPFHTDIKVLANHQELIYKSLVQTQVVALKTCQKQRKIEMNGKKESKKSMFAVEHDDDDDDILNNERFVWM